MGSFVSSYSNFYILMAVDYISKWVKAVGLPTNDTKVVINFLRKNVFTCFCTSRAIISNKGNHFCNKYFEALSAKCGVTHMIVTAYHHKLVVKHKFLIGLVKEA